VPKGAVKVNEDVADDVPVIDSVAGVKEQPGVVPLVLMAATLHESETVPV
jgi:hypothetical protein